MGTKTITLETDKGPGTTLAADLAQAGVPHRTVGVRSSIGADLLQIIIQIAGPGITAASAVLAAYVARGQTIVIVQDGKRKEVSDDAKIAEIFSDEVGTPPDPALAIIANNFSGFELIGEPVLGEFARDAGSMMQRASAYLPETNRKVKLVFFAAQSMRSEVLFVDGKTYVCIDVRQIQMITSFLRATFGRDIFYLHELYRAYSVIVNKYRNNWANRVGHDRDLAQTPELGLEYIYQELRKSEIRDLRAYHSAFERDGMTDETLFKLAFAFLLGHELGHAIHDDVPSGSLETLSVLREASLTIRKLLELDVKFSRDEEVGELFIRGNPAERNIARGRISALIAVSEHAKIDEEVFCDILGTYFLSLEAKKSGFNGRTIANMAFALPSLILHWIIDLDIIQTIDCECFSELSLKRVLAKFAKKTRISTYYEGVHGFFLHHLLLNVVNGDPIPTVKEARMPFKMTPEERAKDDARTKEIFELGHDYTIEGGAHTFSSAPFLWGLVAGQFLFDRGNPYSLPVKEHLEAVRAQHRNTEGRAET